MIHSAKCIKLDRWIHKPICTWRYFFLKRLLQLKGSYYPPIILLEFYFLKKTWGFFLFCFLQKTEYSNVYVSCFMCDVISLTKEWEVSSATKNDDGSSRRKDSRSVVLRLFCPGCGSPCEQTINCILLHFMWTEPVIPLWTVISPCANYPIQLSYHLCRQSAKYIWIFCDDPLIMYLFILSVFCLFI